MMQGNSKHGLRPNMDYGVFGSTFLSVANSGHCIAGLGRAWTSWPCMLLKDLVTLNQAIL